MTPHGLTTVLPGMVPGAYKRNVLVLLAYLYVASLAASLL